MALWRTQRKVAGDMTTEQWDEVKQLFEAMLTKPSENREGLLLAASDNEIVRAEVARLLEQHDKVGDFSTLSPLVDQRGHWLDLPVDKGFSGTSRFTVLGELGHGRFGVVYRVLDRERNSVVALKVLRCLDATQLSRFKHEFRSLVDLVHPNLVQIYELFGEDDTWFFTMELVEGTDFLSHARPNNVVQSWDRIRDTLAHLTEGVHALHTFARLHRDLKPSNILVSNTGQVVILDFGLVKHLDGISVEQSVTLAGSPAYMAPEQLGRGTITTAVDWYAVGVMLFRAITGVFPFDGAWHEILRQKQDQEAPNPKSINCDVPDDLNEVCRDLLQRSPELRPDGPSILRRLRHSAVATPSRAHGHFVGRSQELNLFQRCFQRLDSDGHQVVLLQGCSGIGKTTLVGEFLHRVLEQRPETVILRGRCRESESLPYKALDSAADQLVQYLRALPQADATAMLPRHPTLLARMFPCFRDLDVLAQFPERVDTWGDGQEVRRLAFSALCETFERIADRQPLVISIDDLQWGDLDSIALLAELVVPANAPRLMLILSFRSEDAGTSPPVKLFRTYQARLALPTCWTEVTLAGLDEREGCDLLRSLDTNVSLEEEQLKGMVVESHGSPLFLRELLRATLQDGHRNDTRQPTVPISIAEMITLRTSALSEFGRQLFEAISVAVYPLSRAMLSRTLNMPDVELSRQISILVQENLIRISGGSETGQLEPYHDQVREALLASMDAADIKLWHSRLAQTLETELEPDPTRLLKHYLGAGNLASAYRSALAAAAIAEKALAFDQAAVFYSVALSSGQAEPSNLVALYNLRAESLAKAGRGREAAEDYLKAASLTGSDNASELRRAAAEQLIRSGYLEEGIELFTNLLRSNSVRIPSSRLETLLRMLVIRLFIRLRGLKWRECPEAEIPGDTLLRLDLLWSGAMTLVTVDTIAGSYLQALHMLTALRTGEPSRLASTFAFGAVYESIGGTHEYEHGRKLIQMAHRLTKQVNDPFKWAVSYACWAGLDLLAGHVSDGLAHARTAVAGMQEANRHSRAWELGTANMLVIWFLGWGGQIRELSQALPVLVEEGRSRSDVYTEAYLRCCGVSHLVELAADRPEDARSEMRSSIKLWRKSSYDLPHFYTTLAGVECLLYEGHTREARELLLSDWKAIKKSLFTRKSQIHRTILFYLRGRTSLAEWLRNAGNDTLRLDVEKFAGRLRRVDSPWSIAYSMLLHAGVAAGLERPADALDLLSQAEDILREQDLRLFAAAVSRRRGQLEGDKGLRRIEDAESFMAAENIKRPDRMAFMLLPY